MTDRRPSSCLRGLLATAVVMGALCSTLAHAQTETPIATFPDGTTSTNPYTLISDGHGNLFGTADGGTGTLFELSPASGGGWTVTTIYSFPTGNINFYPKGIVMDAAGNICGITTDGGSLDFGTICELSPRE